MQHRLWDRHLASGVSLPGGLSHAHKGQLMFKNIEEIQKLNKNQIEIVSAAASTFAKGLKQLADETAEYAKKQYEASSSAAEKFLGAKSLEDKIAIQTDFAKTTIEGFVAQATKVGALYTDLAKDAFRPFQEAFSKTPATN
jgi:hypothetical protein